MTNNQIIFEESQKLAEAGKIQYTGRVFKAVDGDGNPCEVKETEEIHTFADWKARGYFVKKGEKAVASFPIWNFTNKPNKARREAAAENGEEINADPHYYMKNAYFFTINQTTAATKMLPAIIY